MFKLRIEINKTQLPLEDSVLLDAASNGGKERKSAVQVQVCQVYIKCPTRETWEDSREVICSKKTKQNQTILLKFSSELENPYTPKLCTVNKVDRWAAVTTAPCLPHWDRSFSALDKTCSDLIQNNISTHTTVIFDESAASHAHIAISKEHVKNIFLPLAVQDPDEHFDCRAHTIKVAQSRLAFILAHISKTLG